MGAGVAEFLAKTNIPIISARAYAEQFPSDVAQWKTQVRPFSNYLLYYFIKCNSIFDLIFSIAII